MSAFTRSVAEVKQNLNSGLGADDLSLIDACNFVSTVWANVGAGHPVTATIKLAEPFELAQLARHSASNQAFINEALKQTEA